MTLTDDTIKCVRDILFLEALEASLATSGDTLVQRRKTNGFKLVKQKHITDIWHLVHSIRSNTLVPRTLLCNGKRSRAELSFSQAHHQRDVNNTTNIFAQPSCSNSATQILQGHDCADSNSLPQRSTTNENSTTRHNDDTFCSIVANDIGNLKASVVELKREVQELRVK